jgi:hypothetical protein
MRYLALLLLAPWLLVLCWIYSAYPRRLPRTRSRRLFDLTAVLLMLAAAARATIFGFDRAYIPEVNEFGQVSGVIWQQVLPALYGYAAFTAVLVLAILLRQWIWGRRRA